MYQTLVVPSQELQRLRNLLESPAYHEFKASFPGLSAAAQAPLPDIRPVLKAALGAHAMQAVLAAQRPEPRLGAQPAEVALREARALYAALNSQMAQVDSACHLQERGSPADAAGACV